MLMKNGIFFRKLFWCRYFEKKKILLIEIFFANSILLNDSFQKIWAIFIPIQTMKSQNEIEFFFNLL